MNVQKIVINRTSNGVGVVLSQEARTLFKTLTGRSYTPMDQHTSELVQVVEILGPKASAPGAEVKVVEIPSDVKWYVENNDGLEVVQECARCWA